MPNLFGFDAGLGSINGKNLLVFGLDTIARMEGRQANLPVLISHELFHIYHSSVHPESKGQRGKDIPLWRLVWAEGLATYASQRLHPKADLSAVLRSPSLAASCEERLKPLVDLLLMNIDRSDTDAVMEWMSGRARTSDVPPRAGYYLGWRIATALGRSRSLRGLAVLPDAEIPLAMKRELDNLQQGREP